MIQAISQILILGLNCSRNQLISEYFGLTFIDFTSNYYLFFGSYLLGYLSLFISNKKLKKAPSWQNAAILLLITIGCQIFYVRRIYDHSVGLVFITIIFLLNLISLSLFSSLFEKNIKRDRKSFDEHSKMFRRLSKTPSDFKEKNWLSLKVKYGYLLLTNIFRGIMVLGNAGSGKSFSIINPIIRFFVEIKASIFLYDYDFPNLSNILFNRHKLYKEQNITDKRSFKLIYFGTIRYHRCNPFDPTFIRDISLNNDLVETLCYSVNKDWANNSGDKFFSESAITIMKAVTWYLNRRSVQKGLLCSTLPHAIELLAFKNYFMLIDILNQNQDVQTLMSGLNTAIQTGADKQLGGQLGSIQMASAKLSIPNMYYIMGGVNEVNLEINHKDDPTILCIGGNQLVHRPFLSAIATTVSYLINQKDRLPCGFIVDELPTIFIHRLENLLNTGRKHLISVVVGIQSISQLFYDYGNQIGKILERAFGTMFIGATSSPEEAKIGIDILGKYKHKKDEKSYSRSKHGTSSTTSKREIDTNYLTVDEAMTLEKGHFVGKLSETLDGYDTKVYDQFVAKEYLEEKEAVPILNNDLIRLFGDIVENESIYHQEEKYILKIYNENDQGKIMTLCNDYGVTAITLNNIIERQELYEFIKLNFRIKEEKKIEHQEVNKTVERIKEEAKEIILNDFFGLKIRQAITVNPLVNELKQAEDVEQVKDILLKHMIIDDETPKEAKSVLSNKVLNNLDDVFSIDQQVILGDVKQFYEKESVFISKEITYQDINQKCIKFIGQRIKDVVVDNVISFTS